MVDYYNLSVGTKIECIYGHQRGKEYIIASPCEIGAMREEQYKVQDVNGSKSVVLVREFEERYFKVAEECKNIEPQKPVQVYVGQKRKYHKVSMDSVRQGKPVKFEKNREYNREYNREHVRR